ncbi:MAG: hypothetical protein ACON4R_10970 [Akkermansiaceae bacterium]
MARCPVIITPAFIRRHNFRCLGRVALASCGAAAVFLVVFVFGWLLASVVTGNRNLDLPALIFATIFASAVFGFGHRYLAKNGPQDWEKIARKPDRKPGMRLGRMSNQDYGQIGQGFFGLLLAGPGWIGKIFDAWKAMMPANEEFANRMESLRLHFAARDAWAPMRDFKTHEANIYLLTRLNILAVREMQGEWYFHVTLEGMVKRENH